MSYKHRIKNLERKTQIGREFKPVVLFESDFPNCEELQNKSEEMSAQGFKVYRVTFIDKSNF
jgi:hypothetical protein